ncbi:MAG: cyclic nucleotide-binding domain-containing protein [Actinomycetia bacterium]|nr:cyclic nucleotide-binding domain-containing protein [Actinomycetes bacterium]
MAPATVDALLAVMSFRSIAAGEVLCRRGEIGVFAHLVLAGRLRVHRIAPDGREIVLATVGGGRLVGETAPLGDQWGYVQGDGDLTSPQSADPALDRL